MKKNILFACITSALLVLSCNLDKIDDKAAQGCTVFPVADFSTTNTIVGDSSIVVFTNASTGASSYLWNFGTAGTSTAISPTVSLKFGQTYLVQLIAISNEGCRDTVQTSLAFAGIPPTADFSFNNNGCFAPCGITFTNASMKASTYSWDFGDGTATVSDPSPSHTFEIAGTYIVTLTASGTGGTNSITKTVTVNSIRFRKDDPNVYYSAVEVADDGYIVAGSSGLGLNGKAAVWKFNLSGQQVDFTSSATLTTCPFARAIAKSKSNFTYAIAGHAGSCNPFEDGFVYVTTVQNLDNLASGSVGNGGPCSSMYSVAPAADGGFMLCGFSGDCDQGSDYKGQLVKVNDLGAGVTSRADASVENFYDIIGLTDGFLVSGCTSIRKLDLLGNETQNISIGGCISTILPVSDGYILAGSGKLFKMNTTFNVTQTADVPQIGGTFSMTYGKIVAPTHDGGYVVVMVSSSTLKLVKVNNNLEYVWDVSYSGSFNSGGALSHYYIKSCPDGGFAVCGYGTGFFLKTDHLGKIN